MRVSKVRAIFLFLLAPGRFNELAVQYHQHYVEEIKKRYGGAPTEFDRQESQRNNREQAARLRTAFIRSLSYVFWALVLAVLSGIISARVFGIPQQLALVVLQLFGAFMLLGATLWQIGEAASASGGWLAEKVHNWMFMSFYVIGTYLLGWAVSWDGVCKLFAP